MEIKNRKPIQLELKEEEVKKLIDLLKKEEINNSYAEVLRTDIEVMLCREQRKRDIDNIKYTLCTSKSSITLDMPNGATWVEGYEKLSSLFNSLNDNIEEGDYLEAKSDWVEIVSEIWEGKEISDDFSPMEHDYYNVEEATKMLVDFKKKYLAL